MKLVIVSAAPFIFKDKKCFAYSPYVKELVVWEKYATEISFCCPVWKSENGLLVEEISFEIKKHFKLIDFNLNDFVNIVKAFFNTLYNILIIFEAMHQADHIHLRCPGNIGLLGCLIQILFPNKPKTAKYAGNWDPKANQPWSYRLQKWILDNTFLTRNMQVLVYGEWEGSSTNIMPFFTATYQEADKLPLADKNLKGLIRFVFVGTLVKGKNPMYAIQFVEAMSEKGYNVVLDLYGEGGERMALEGYIRKNKLEEIVLLKGNQTAEGVKKAYQDSHFVILPSKSEGWPKVIAEGMFWGCVPVATPVSCVPFMLDHGNRGVLLEGDLERSILQIEVILKNGSDFELMRNKAAAWSRNYTLDVFEEDVSRLLNGS